MTTLKCFKSCSVQKKVIRRNHESCCGINNTGLTTSGTFAFTYLLTTGDTSGLIDTTAPVYNVNYTATYISNCKVKLNIDPFTAVVSATGGSYIISESGLLPGNFAPTSARYINFNAGSGVFGHVFRDGSVRFSSSLNNPLPPGTYNIPATTVTYHVCSLNLPAVNNIPVAQGLTNATLNQGIFDNIVSSPNSIDNLEYFTIIYTGGKIYAAWGDNSPQIKNQGPTGPYPDPFTRIAFAVLNEDGTYVIAPKNVGDTVPTTTPPYPPINPGLTAGAQMEVSLAMDPTNPLKLNMGSWSINNAVADPSQSNFKAFYARSDDGGNSWQALDLFAQNFVPKLQNGSITGDHTMKYDKFGNLFYEMLGGYYASLPFDPSNILNLRPLPDIYYSSNNGQIFDEVFKGLGIHNDVFGLDYPESTLSQEPDGSSVFWLTMKQIATFDEAFETGDSFPQLSYAIKMNGLHEFSGIRYIELPDTTNGGYGSMAAGLNGNGADVAVTGLPVRDNFGAFNLSNSSLWSTYNQFGFNGSYNGISFFANSNVGYRGVYPPQTARETWPQPNIAIDLNDRWYVAYVDGFVPTGTGPVLSDIILIYSDNKGATWSPTYKVNNVSTYSRLQPQIKIDSTTNKVLVAWLDARDNTGSPSSAALVRPYYAIFPDGFFPVLKHLPAEYSSQPAASFFDSPNPI